ncbi:hypothetical protein ACFL6M_01505 [Candidatus Eisenbacteria bacterium]|uniref:Type II/III secretion system secretin-like domain-containing protein n=1 Tax=Eiseniibacteriota bacterium TaxID=2212470 RepID=A0ABV6YJD6_UNCEI
MMGHTQSHSGSRGNRCHTSRGQRRDRARTRFGTRVILTIALLVAAGLTWPSVSSSSSDRLETASKQVRRDLAKKVSLTFKDMATTEALKVLSEQSGVNMAVASGVGGKVSLFLTDVDVATALDIVTEMTGNAYMAEGDIVRVMSADEYFKKTGNAFASHLVLHTYELEHMVAADAVVAIRNMGLMTAAGKILPDAQLNSLFVWDVAESHERIGPLLEAIDRETECQRIVLPLQFTGNDALQSAVSAHLTAGIGSVELLGGGDRIAITDLPNKIGPLADLVYTLDVSPKQVLIEVKILQVTHSDETMVGINWQVVQEKMNSLDIRSAYSVLPKSGSGDVSSGSVLTVGNLEDDDFHVVLEALETFGTADIVSLPRILARSGSAAKIHVGSSEPFVTVSTRESQGIINYYETVTHVDVGVKLDITPEIHPNGFISMTVRPEVSTVSRFETTVSGSTIPVVEQAMMETVVHVKSGVWVILGGLIKNELRVTKSGIPILRSIPLLEYLFGSTNTKEVKNELVVLIRPRVVSGDVPVELDDATHEPNPTPGGGD